MDVGYGGCEDLGCLVLVRSQEDAVAVHIIGDEEVVVSSGGRVGETACLVCVYEMLGGRGS